MRLLSVNHYMLWRHPQPAQPDVSSPIGSTEFFRIFGILTVDAGAVFWANQSFVIQRVNIPNFIRKRRAPLE
jgi:hypothetical protein